MEHIHIIGGILYMLQLKKNMLIECISKKKNMRIIFENDRQNIYFKSIIKGSKLYNKVIRKLDI